MNLWVNTKQQNKTPTHLQAPKMQSLGHHDNTVPLEKVSSPQF